MVFHAVQGLKGAHKLCKGLPFSDLLRKEVRLNPGLAGGQVMPAICNR
jgi:hypothetical protein